MNNFCQGGADVVRNLGEVGGDEIDRPSIHCQKWFISLIQPKDLILFQLQNDLSVQYL